MNGSTVSDGIGAVVMTGHNFHQLGLDVGEKSSGFPVNDERIFLSV